MVGDYIIPQEISLSARACKSINMLMDAGWVEDLLQVQLFLSDLEDNACPVEVSKDLHRKLRELRKVLLPLTQTKNEEPIVLYRNKINIGTVKAGSEWELEHKHIMFDDREQSKTLIFAEWEDCFEKI